MADPEDDANYDPLNAAKKKDRASNFPDEELEGYSDDPTLTKVVDRRWYEKNKHVFPASVWEEFDVTKDYSKGIRKDLSGNSFFFS
jgi:protein FAM50